MVRGAAAGGKLFRGWFPFETVKMSVYVCS
jgi:hypothetical protein